MTRTVLKVATPETALTLSSPVAAELTSPRSEQVELLFADTVIVPE
jgi:hypothetical protein